jgi:hypothetical protein
MKAVVVVVDATVKSFCRGSRNVTRHALQQQERLPLLHACI